MSRFVLIILLSVGTLLAKAQTTYNMSNSSISDCQGTLLDSEAGPNGSTYGNNEDYTFTICSGGKITMKFDTTFCLESGYDFLRIYNGPDTNSTLMGTYTGNNAPPTIIATSGCLTLHFKSDANTAYCGWEADWTTEKVPPVPPTMQVNPVPSCSTTTITLTYSGHIPCDSIDVGDFTVTGPVNNISVTSLTSSLNCRFPGDSTNTLTLYLNKSLSKDCWYNVDMELGLPDNCDSIWYFNLVDSFQIIDCPFTVDISASNDTICAGMCTDLYATVNGTGPNCLTYNYNWSAGLPNSPGTHSVCPTGTVTYSVLVQSTLGGPSVAAQKTIVFVNPEISTQDSMTLCQSDTAFNIAVLGTGGIFSGPGIVNSTTGLFDPDVAGPGSHWIKYGFTNFCEDSILITILAIDAGLDQAACPGGSPFMLGGFTPPGGIWSGDSVTSAGLFNPAVSGKYTLTYSVNGCTERKVVTVDSIVLNTPLDTVCQSDTAFIINISPPGGRWTGPGITDSVLGWFSPTAAGIGTKTLTYKLSGSGNSGCSFDIDVTVNQIEAYWNLLACPSQPPFTLNPAGIPSGGSWSGYGITNATSGTYDPSTAFSGGQGNDTLTYTAQNGCSDTRIVYVRYTRIYDDTAFFCLSDPWINLVWATVRRTPGGGSWTGSGLTNNGNNYRFHPNLAGVGVHKLYYDANTCVDSIIMVGYPEEIKFAPFNFLWPDTTVCSTHPAWNFPQMPAGGKWVGQGITNSKTGTYNPAAAGSGTHIVKYVTPNGCVNDSVVVTVYPFVPAQILGLDSIYCYKDTLIPFTIKPAKGNLTGTGIVNGTYFNPAVAGTGTHTFNLSYGNGLCETSTSLTIKVGEAIETDLIATDTFLCPGETTTLTVTAEGGSGGVNLDYEWNNGLFPVSEHIVNPDSTTTYIVKTKDGCSDPGIDTVTIHVAPPIRIDITSSDSACYGDDGWLKATNRDTGDFQYTWNLRPPVIDDSLGGNAGSSYELVVYNKLTGCEFDTTAKIPAYQNVVANFTNTPNFDCLPSDQKEVTFLDLSQNADSGRWDFNGQKTVPWVFGQNPTYTFSEAGYYTVTLIVYNKGGCPAEYSKELCVEDIRPVFVADAFTPNGDGVNDVLHVKGRGFKELRFQIFDRWGNLVFESTDPEDGWNGKYRGLNANAGVYVWVVEVKLINNETKVEKGNVTLVR